MRNRVTAAAVALACLGMAGGEVAWEKPDAALARAAATGKPVCTYFLSNEITKSGDGGGSC